MPLISISLCVPASARIRTPVALTYPILVAAEVAIPQPSTVIAAITNDKITQENLRSLPITVSFFHNIIITDYTSYII